MKKGKYFIQRDQCPVCQSVDLTLKYECEYTKPPLFNYLLEFYGTVGGVIEFNYLEDACFSLVQCNLCDLIFQKYVPNNELAFRLYEKWIDPSVVFNQHLITDDLDTFCGYAQEISTFIDYFNVSPRKLDFLDYGMGWGKWALMAKAFGCNSFGFELSNARRDYASLNALTVVNWKDIPKRKFDLINTEQVFEHLSDPLETILHLKSGLKEGGILKISVPNASNIQQRLRHMDWQAKKGTRLSLNPVAPLEHINCFQRKSLEKMGERVGMREVQIPIAMQYSHATNWRTLKRFMENIGAPIYRNFLKKHNYVLLRIAE